VGGVDIPILLLVDDDLDGRSVAESQLRSRYGTDYQVICAGSGDDPVRLLAELRDGQRQVSVVLAAQSMRGMTGTGLLAGPGPSDPPGGQIPAADRLGVRAAPGGDPAGHRTGPHR
jgi:CheY-like chemotaxis protein